jgi:hypothetical protein
MEIYLDRRAVRQIRTAAQDAIDEGDTESSREEIMDAFSEDQIEEIERRLDHGDMFEFLTDILDEWSGEDVDELMELIEAQLGEVGIELKVDEKDDEEEEEDEEVEADEEEETIDEDEEVLGDEEAGGDFADDED